MFNNAQFREYIVKPVLNALNLYSQEAEDLMVGICAHESKGGTYFKQINGTAMGPYEMQRDAHDHIWNAFLPSSPQICYNLMTICELSRKPTFEMLQFHLRYATAMTRIYFVPIKESIPKDLQGQAEYWKKYYNTVLGKGTVQEYIDDYLTFIGANLHGKENGKISKESGKENAKSKAGS